MIETFSDFLSAIIIVLIPLIICILLIRGLLRSFSGHQDPEEEKQIEYYKEW